MTFVTAPLAGALADRVGYRPVLSFGLFAQTIGMGWLAVVAGGSPSYSALVVPLIVTGIGTSAALITNDDSCPDPADVADGFVASMAVATTLAAVAFCFSLTIPRSERL